METRLQTGTLVVTMERNDTGLPPDQVFGIGARANPRRGFLIVSHLIGRHLPTTPRVMRKVMDDLAGRIDPDLPGPVLFVGMAETAVGLGQGVHAAWRRLTGRDDALFIQSTRQTHPDLAVWTRFEEGHSHASSHIIHRPSDVETFERCRSVVMVDDECSTGKTFRAAGAALDAVLRGTSRKVECVVTDWSPDRGAEAVSLMSGQIEWTAGKDVPPQLAATANRHGETGPRSSPGRTGYAVHPGVGDVPTVDGRRVLVLSDGENAYDALVVAEALEQRGHVTAIQSITRSPALLGNALRSVGRFTDSHGSGADCFAYNLEAHGADAVVVVTEREGAQREEVRQATGLPDGRITIIVTDAERA